jgi:hypothetical protein
LVPVAQRRAWGPDLPGYPGVLLPIRTSTVVVQETICGLRAEDAQQFGLNGSFCAGLVINAGPEGPGDQLNPRLQSPVAGLFPAGRGNLFLDTSLTFFPVSARFLTVT